MLLSVGGMGDMASTTPLQALLAYTDWRGAFFGLAMDTLLFSLLLFAVVPEHPHRQETRLADMARAVRQLYGAWSFWRLALYSLFAHATSMAVQGLWMGPWLRDVAHLDRGAGVAGALFAGTVAMVLGAPGFGWLTTDRLRRVGVQSTRLCGAGISCFLVFRALMVAGWDSQPLLAFLVQWGLGQRHQPLGRAERPVSRGGLPLGPEGEPGAAGPGPAAVAVVQALAPGANGRLGGPAAPLGMAEPRHAA